MQEVKLKSSILAENTIRGCLTIFSTCENSWAIGIF